MDRGRFELQQWSSHRFGRFGPHHRSSYGLGHSRRSLAGRRRQRDLRCLTGLAGEVLHRGQQVGHRVGLAGSRPTGQHGDTVIEHRACGPALQVLDHPRCSLSRIPTRSGVGTESGKGGLAGWWHIRGTGAGVGVRRVAVGDVLRAQVAVEHCLHRGAVEARHRQAEMVVAGFEQCVAHLTFVAPVPFEIEPGTVEHQRPDPVIEHPRIRLSRGGVTYRHRRRCHQCLDPCRRFGPFEVDRLRICVGRIPRGWDRICVGEHRVGHGGRFDADVAESQAPDAQGRCQQHRIGRACDGAADRRCDVNVGRAQDLCLDEALERVDAGRQPPDHRRSRGRTRPRSAHERPPPSRSCERATTSSQGGRQAARPCGVPSSVGVSGPTIPRTNM